MPNRFSSAVPSAELERSEREDSRVSFCRRRRFWMAALCALMVAEGMAPPNAGAPTASGGLMRLRALFLTSPPAVGTLAR